MCFQKQSKLFSLTKLNLIQFSDYIFQYDMFKLHEFRKELWVRIRLMARSQSQC